jgi:hypothetical protein
LVVRLTRAGIPTARISVLHPAGLKPNSTLCWIKGSVSYPLASGDQATVSGMLGLRLAAQERKWSRYPLIDGLCNVGLSLDQSLNVEETLLGNGIIVAVEVADESQLPAIYHTLRGLSVQKVQTADTPIHLIGAETRATRQRMSYGQEAILTAMHAA